MEKEKDKFKSNPYNKNNHLINSSDIINILSSLNINDTNYKVHNINIYRQAFTHKSYCKLKDYEEYKNINNDLELQDVSYETIELDYWVEYINCMVLSYNWGSIIPTEEGKQLAEAMAPKLTARISLSGGLKDPNGNAWLEGYPPSIKLYTFEMGLTIRISTYPVAENQILELRNFPNQEEQQLDSSQFSAGDYIIEAYSGKILITKKRLRVISWNEIQVNEYI